jgi:hypothetical protein
MPRTASRLAALTMHRLANAAAAAACPAHPGSLRLSGVWRGSGAVAPPPGLCGVWRLGLKLELLLLVFRLACVALPCHVELEGTLSLSQCLVPPHRLTYSLTVSPTVSLTVCLVPPPSLTVSPTVSLTVCLVPPPSLTVSPTVSLVSTPRRCRGSVRWGRSGCAPLPPSHPHRRAARPPAP